MRHLPIGVDEPKDRAGDEGAEDDLEAQCLGEGGEADQQNERATNADLGGRVLEAGEHIRQEVRAFGASDRESECPSECHQEAHEEHGARRTRPVAGEEDG